jgi:glycosyltransferase 2 family protein
MSRLPSEARSLFAVGGWLLGAALFGWFVLRLDLGAVAAALHDVDFRWLAGAALLQVAGLAWRGVRWRSMIARRAPVPWRSALAVTFMGWLLLVLVPARLGELARPLLLARRHAVDRSYALGAVLLERVLDAAALLGLVAIYLRFAAGSPRSAEASSVFGALERFEAVGAWLAVGAGIALVAVTVAAPWLSRHGDRLSGATRGRGLRWGLDRVRALAGGVTSLRSVGATVTVLTQTMVLWGLVLTAHGCLFRAFDLRLASLEVVPVVFFVVLGALVPVPAAIGAYHQAVQIALGPLLGVAPATAAAYALVAHASAYLPNGTIAALLLAKEGTNQSELSVARSGLR